jgi:hypothetical protein
MRIVGGNPPAGRRKRREPELAHCTRFGMNLAIYSALRRSKDEPPDIPDESLLRRSGRRTQLLAGGGKKRASVVASASKLPAGSEVPGGSKNHFETQRIHVIGLI